MAVVHEAGKRSVFVSHVEMDKERQKQYSDSEQEILRLWKQFFHDISIPERESYERQRQMAGLKYRKNIVEFE